LQIYFGSKAIFSTKTFKPGTYHAMVELVIKNGRELEAESQPVIFIVPSKVQTPLSMVSMTASSLVFDFSSSSRTPPAPFDFSSRRKNQLLSKMRRRSPNRKQSPS